MKFLLYSNTSVILLSWKRFLLYISIVTDLKNVLTHCRGICNKILSFTRFISRKFDKLIIQQITSNKVHAWEFLGMTLVVKPSTIHCSINYKH